MAVFQPPPTYAEVILMDEETKKGTFNPVWLKWFLDLVEVINNSGGGGGTINHNDTAGLQGGAANQFYHATATQYATLSGLGTISTQNANNVSITGGAISGVAITTGSINNTPIGGTTRNSGAFTTLSAAGVLRPATDAGAAQTVVSLFAGNGAPSNANGTDGDFYFRGNGTAGGNTVIYHKEAGSWVALITT